VLFNIAYRELKRREKQRAKDASKASKAAAQPAPVANAAAAPSEDDLNPNVRLLVK
jgi:lysyl-tRNA synthetase class 2